MTAVGGPWSFASRGLAAAQRAAGAAVEQRTAVRQGLACCFAQDQLAKGGLPSSPRTSKPATGLLLCMCLLCDTVLFPASPDMTSSQQVCAMLLVLAFSDLFQRLLLSY